MPNKAYVSDGKIIISFDFSWELVRIVQGIEGRRFNKKFRYWTTPFSEWHRQVVKSRLSAYSFEFDPVLDTPLDDDVDCSKPKVKGLYPFQSIGVDFLCKVKGRGIVADDPGLGKTITTLAYLNKYAGKALIVVPATVLFKWEDECHKWTDRSTQVVLTGATNLDNVDIHIMSYAIMVAKYDELNRTPYDIVMFDEAHYLKSPKSNRTRVARALVSGYIPKVIPISGTPFMNRPTELYPLLNMVDPVSYSNFYKFAQRYAGAQFLDGHWYFADDVVTNPDELAKRLETVMIRRTIGEVEMEIPDLTRTSIPIDIANRAEYSKAVKDLKAWLREQDKTVLNPNHVLTKLNILRQVVGKGKVKAAVELAENILQSGKQVVLFAHHKEVVAELTQAFRMYGAKTIVGDTPTKERSSNYKEFLRQHSSIRVMIISTAGSEGIDLYSAADIIFVERDWTPAKEEQAEGRLRRHGQKNHVNAWYLVARKTIDEKLNIFVENKRRMIKQVIRKDEIIHHILGEL